MEIKPIERRLRCDGVLLSLRFTPTGKQLQELVGCGLSEIAVEAGITGKSDNLHGLLKSRLGAAALDERLSDYVACRLANPLITEENLPVLFNPSLSPDSFREMQSAHPRYIDVQLYLSPAVALSSYEPPHVKEKPIVVTEEMVDVQLEHEIQPFVRLEDAGRPVEEGDLIRANLKTLADGIFEPALSGEGVSIMLTCEQMPAAFVEHATGMRPGETKRFSFQSDQIDERSASPVDFDVELELLGNKRRVVPELSDEFVRNNLSESCKTVAAFRAKIRRFLQEKMTEERRARREAAADAALGERLISTIPDILIERTRDDIIANIRRNAAGIGMTMADFAKRQGMDLGQFELSCGLQARQSLRQGLALDALYAYLEKNAELAIDDKDIEAALCELNPADLEQVRASLDRNESWYFVRNMAKRMKAHDWLMENAVFE